MSCRRDGDVLVVAGTIDEHRITDLDDEVSKYLAECPSGTIDVGAVEFLPSAAIGVLAMAWSRAIQRGDGLTLVAPPGTHAATTLTISGLPVSATRPTSGD